MQIHFSDPANVFSDGLKVIQSYHDSLLEHGHRLLDLVNEIEQQGIDTERANRLAELYAYYQRATTLHHQDEERVLFPSLVGRDILIDGMIERLTLDHEEIEEAWRVLEISLKEILEHHCLSDQLVERTARFEKLQRLHLIRENEDFLPRMVKVLDEHQRQEMGRKMAAMRRKSQRL